MDMIRLTGRNHREGKRRRMRILFLSAVLPMTWGSEVRAFRFLEYLTKGHEVDLISFQAWPGPCPPRDAQSALLADLKARCRDVTRVPLPGVTAWGNCLCNSISEEPFLVAYFRSEPMRSLIRERMDNGRYDLVWVNGLAMAQYTAGSPAPTVLDAGSCASRRCHRLSRLPAAPAAAGILPGGSRADSRLRGTSSAQLQPLPGGFRSGPRGSLADRPGRGGPDRPEYART